MMTLPTFTARISPHFPGFPWRQSPSTPLTVTSTNPSSTKTLGSTVDIAYVLAHPDDETYCHESLRQLAASGYSVQPIYLTKGEQGQDVSGENNPKGAAIAAARLSDLKNHLQALGITREAMTLDFPDGQVREHVPAAVNAVKQALLKIQPKLIISFGPHGMSGHSDHVAVSQITTNAVKALKNMGQLDMKNKGALYQLALSKDKFKAFGKAPCSPRNELYPQKNNFADVSKISTGNTKGLIYFKQHAKKYYKGKYDKVDIAVSLGDKSTQAKAYERHRLNRHGFYPEESKHYTQTWAQAWPHEEFRKTLNYFG